ncbi:glycosyltransferase 87 family protein [Kribbella kalugense]|uniref:Alpha-1,2-mannosyltransferase n=1 Tax=Kribbella kalugense TaxID=2512221 RepID=A0A4R7ZJ26_9ACTN|nr:glycosyltransferase 87 family protein [Kribbella kalugense]TDW17753.1 alpha-1,2-mannosyltransferase [Kribbella kalugense]
MTIDLVPPRVRRGAPVPVLVLAATILPLICVLLWRPSYPMSDLRVYYAAARGLLHGDDIYTVHHQYPGMGLGFTYPPFAAIVLAPLALGQEFGRLLMTLLSGVSLLVIGWTTAKAVGWGRTAGLVIAFAALAFEPVWSTFGLGQLNLVLLALLMLDLLGHLPRRYRGILVGVATGIKLTPSIFIVFLLVTRRFREAAVAAGTTLATIVIGWLVMPGPATDFWTRYIFDPGRPGPAQYVGNQSMRGVIARITHNSAATMPLWLLAATVVGIAGLLTARRLYDRGLGFEAVIVTAFIGLLVSPISWTNHWVWVVPAAAVLWARRRTVFATVWCAVFVLGLPWWMPFAGDREYSWTVVQSVAGDAYPLGALLLLYVLNSEARIR